MDPRAKDYKETLFLPKTDFPMKGNLPNREPVWLERWQKMDIYKRLRDSAGDKEKFILHDGPPYANGNIHIGHALNKILKDVIVRSQQMLGKDAPYVPGWDCHGLPIEWMIEKKYKKAGQNKDEIDPLEFRQECRDFAAKWIDVQRAEFKRLGIFGNWDNPYQTMDFASEAQIVRELLKFAENGGLYKGAKPIMWSVVERTALAEAEIEYEDITSTQIDLAFEIVESPVKELVGAHAVIWTTTPWTIPVNQALAYGPDLKYCLFEHEGKRILVENSLVDSFRQRMGQMDGETSGDGAVELLWQGKGTDLEGTLVRHPMYEKGGFFATLRPFLSGDFVTTDAGTGIVHMAPDHGEDDFSLCKAHGIDPVFAVEDNGTYCEGREWLGGQGNVINKTFNSAEGPICADLFATGQLLAASNDFQHSYPHSWRSKAKIIFRCKSQWFISMEKNGLRDKALNAIDDVRWVPEKGKNRITSMVADRPDWVISRQRAWGVPITVFTHKESGELLNDTGVNERIAAAVEDGGADAWFAGDMQQFLGDAYKAEDYEQVTDILDVWFDSGSTHAFVLEKRDELHAPADLYLEGTDQHRGWFQSSLLESCGTRGVPPYKAVLTHGFTLDGQGRKMSKSGGNTIAPQKIIDQFGADILRLWVTSSDYMNDHRIGDEIIKGQVEAYRKIRNTFRFMIGNLNDFDEDEKLPLAEMPELEQWMLHRIHELDLLVRGGFDDFSYNRIYVALYNFCTVDLSAFYFDIRKDGLYCDAKSSIRRRATRTVLDIVFHALTRWYAPILAFTTEEVWQTRFPSDDDSIHLKELMEIPASWKNDDLAEKWSAIRKLRRVVTGALEVERREKRIGSSLQGTVKIYVQDATYIKALDGIDLAEISITSGAELIDGAAPHGAFQLDDVADVAVVSVLAEGGKCGRCWQVLPEVSGDQDICLRCVEAVEAQS